jgi:hypothetical protein
MKVDELTRRPTEYLNDSGVTWLTSGSAFVLMGVAQLIWPILVRQHPNSALAVQWAGVVLVWLVLLAGLKLRQRFVFPRAGYAAPRRSPWVRAAVAGLVCGGIIFVWLIWMFARGGHFALGEWQRFVAPGFALLAAGIAWQGKSRLGFLFAIYLLFLGAALWSSQLNAFAGMSWLQVGIGGPLVVYGAIRLRKFVETNPGPATE